MLWIWLTLGAAAAQTARNTLQRSLVTAVGTLGATQVRFMFGLPFAFLFLAILAVILEVRSEGGQIGIAVQSFSLGVLSSLLVGSVFQILATAFMLTAMEKQSFVVVTAITKTEPLLVALFGFCVLGDSLTAMQWLAVAMATRGSFGDNLLSAMAAITASVAVAVAIGLLVAAIVSKLFIKMPLFDTNLLSLKASVSNWL